MPTDSKPADRSFLFLPSSARTGGNAEALARRAAAALPRAVPQTWLDLARLPLAPFEDIRHSVGVYPAPEGHARTLFDATLAATDLVFVVPVYWYAVPASAKLYLDHWSGWMRVEGADFRGRMAGKQFWAVTILSDRDLRQAEPLLGTLRLCADYLKAQWGGSVVGFANKPGDVLADHAALADADRLFAAGGDLASSFRP